MTTKPRFINRFRKKSLEFLKAIKKSKAITIDTYRMYKKEIEEAKTFRDLFVVVTSTTTGTNHAYQMALMAAVKGLKWADVEGISND